MSYKGLCVGGTSAGEWISNDRPEFFAGLHLGINRLSGGHYLIVEAEYGVEMLDPTNDFGTNYVHVRGGGGCDFWVPRGKNRSWAMQELVRSYRQEHLPRIPETVQE